ncbi:MAG TPA: DUF2490 domain-containing protein [Gemmatimonadaceae bacterium]
MSLTATIARAQGTQAWGEVDLVALFPRVALTTPIVVRSEPGPSTPDFIGSGALADVTLPWNATLTGGFLTVRLTQHKATLVQLPLVAVSESFHLGTITAFDRNRVEQLLGFGTSPRRYRNRLLLDAPLDHGAWHLFGDDEEFYDFSSRAWTQNRARLGAGHQLAERAVVDVYYLRKTVRPTTTHVVGVTVRIQVTRPRQGKTSAE